MYTIFLWQRFEKLKLRGGCQYIAGSFPEASFTFAEDLSSATADNGQIIAAQSLKGIQHFWSNLLQLASGQDVSNLSRADVANKDIVQIPSRATTDTGKPRSDATIERVPGESLKFVSLPALSQTYSI